MVKSCTVVVLGGEGSGKTSLVLRYVQSRFSDSYDPHVLDAYKREDNVHGEAVVFQIVDICGADAFADLRSKQCAEADGFIFVADASSADSIEDVFSIRQSLLLESALKPSVLAVAKCDAGSPSDQVSKRAGAWGMPVVQFSSKEDYGIEDVFHELACVVVPGLKGHARRLGASFISKTPTAEGRSADSEPILLQMTGGGLSGSLGAKDRQGTLLPVRRPTVSGTTQPTPDVDKLQRTPQKVSLLVPLERPERQSSVTPLDGFKAIDPSVQSPLTLARRKVTSPSPASNPSVNGLLAIHDPPECPLPKRGSTADGRGGDLLRPLLSSPVLGHPSDAADADVLADGDDFDVPSSAKVDPSESQRPKGGKNRFLLSIIKPTVMLKNMAPFTLGPASNLPPEDAITKDDMNRKHEMGSPSVGSGFSGDRRNAPFIPELSPDRADASRKPVFETQPTPPPTPPRKTWYQRCCCCCCRS